MGVEPIELDWCGRSLGIVTPEDATLVKEEIVRAGFAWLYPRFCKKPVCSEWKRLEDEARAAQRGLWNDKNPLQPWDWRAQYRKPR